MDVDRIIIFLQLKIKLKRTSLNWPSNTCQLSTVNCQLSTVNCQLSTVNCYYQVSSVNCQLSPVNYPQTLSWLRWTLGCLAMKDLSRKRPWAATPAGKNPDCTTLRGSRWAGGGIKTYGSPNQCKDQLRNHMVGLFGLQHLILLLTFLGPTAVLNTHGKKCQALRRNSTVACWGVWELIICYHIRIKKNIYI